MEFFKRSWKKSWNFDRSEVFELCIVKRRSLWGERVGKIPVLLRGAGLSIFEKMLLGTLGR